MLFSGLYLPIAIASVLKYNPDQDRTTCEIVQARGFPCEIHSVITRDGYIVDLHRIPPTRAGNGKPVLLLPGLTAHSAAFVIASDSVNADPSIVGHNVAFELAKHGYDVWMGNNRGSKYGMRHLWLHPESDAFWEFTFDDIAMKDIPVFLDYVRHVSKRPKLHVIGYSQGTSVIFALLSQTPAYNEAIESFIAVTPVSRIGGARTAFRTVLRIFKRRYQRGGRAYARRLPISKNPIRLACEAPVGRTMCIIIFSAIMGPNLKELNIKRLPVYMSQIPTSTAAKNFLHFDQLFTSNRFQKYDHGPEGNLIHYGTPYPASYNLRAISHKHMYIIYSQSDAYVPLEGIEKLLHSLPQAREFYPLSDPKANHADPVLGLTMARETNGKILEILSRYP